jgi:hypothetical protein
MKLFTKLPEGEAAFTVHSNWKLSTKDPLMAPGGRMAQAPVSNRSAVLDDLFRTAFVKAAPLYRNSFKIKLPYEDLKTTTTLYRGSLHEETRTVESISDYEMLRDPEDTEEVIQLTEKLATEAGILVDGLIRLENGKLRDGADVRDVTAVYVTDVFEHTDGRRNLNFLFVDALKNGWNPADPFGIKKGWIAYRFYFACARIRQKYEYSTTL